MCFQISGVCVSPKSVTFFDISLNKGQSLRFCANVLSPSLLNNSTSSKHSARNSCASWQFAIKVPFINLNFILTDSPQMISHHPHYIPFVRLAGLFYAPHLSFCCNGCVSTLGLLLTLHPWPIFVVALPKHRHPAPRKLAPPSDSSV